LFKWSVTALDLCCGNDREHNNNEDQQSRHCAHAPRATEVCREVPVAPIGANARVEKDLVDQLFNSSEKRLARALLLMANFGKDESPVEPVIAKISQETLAEMIGTTRARVNTFMNKFRKLGFVEYNGGMKVHPSLLNVVLRN
jgi:Crp-like helix-turn-helix domain